MIDSSDNNASAIIHAARELGKSETVKPTRERIGNVEVLMHQNGNVTSLERYADNPRRKRANVGLYEAASFIEYVNRHKVSGRTHLFGQANELGGSFTAVFDFHQEEINSHTSVAPVGSTTAPELADPKVVGFAGNSGPLAGWGEHTAKLTLETTPEWRRWIEKNTKLLSQEQFSEHIEDNLLDILEPAGADILDMAQLLQGKKSVNFKAGKNLKNGTIQLEYVEQVELQGNASRRDDSMVVPDKFKLGLIPFVGAFGVEIEARLRFRIGDGGKLSFAYILNRPYKVIEDAFKHTREDIETKTGLKVMLGSGSITSV